MNAMKNIKIEHIIGVWECESYILVITNECIVLTDKKTNIHIIDEPIFMKDISSEKDKSTFNTIPLSKSIYICQIINDDNLFVTIKEEKIKLNRKGFINEFKFYRNTEIPSKYIAIRWYSPWEYIAMVEFQGLEVIRVLTGKNEYERTEINEYHTNVLMCDKWIEFSFFQLFPNYKQSEIVESIKKQLL